MSEKISWKINVDVDGDSISPISGYVEVDSSATIEATVPEGVAGNPGIKTVEVLLTGAGDSSSGKFVFISITSSLYDEELTYSITNGVSDVKLDAPQFLAGEGAVGLLDETALEFKFNNEAVNDKEATIEILFGWKATS